MVEKTNENDFEKEFNSMIIDNNEQAKDKVEEDKIEEVFLQFNNNNIDQQKNEANEQVLTEEEYFIECCRYNDIEGVKDVLECNVVKLNYQDKYKNSALHMASANSNLDIMRMILKAGIQVDLQNESGNTALHWAAMNNNFEGVKLLVEYNSDIKIKNNTDKAAAEEAFDRGYNEISDYLIEIEVEHSKSSSIMQDDFEIKELEEDLVIDEDDIPKENK